MNKLLLVYAKTLNRLFNSTKGKRKYYDAWKYVHSIGLLGMGRAQGNNAETSGENNILKQVISAGGDVVTIIDVGANKGQYSTIACSMADPAKKLQMHLFEPSAENKSLLTSKFTPQNFPGCTFKINQLALSNKSGSSFLYTDAEGSDLGSLINLKVTIRPFDESKKEEVQMVTLDEYALENNIDKIDLLKIDVEGAEYFVLSGGKNSLQERKIKNIQFEFGAGNITSKVFFHDFWELLSPMYNFFQIVSDGVVPIPNYSVDLEVFKTANFFLSLKKGIA